MTRKAALPVLVSLWVTLSWNAWAADYSKAFDELDRETGKSAAQPRPSAAPAISAPAPSGQVGSQSDLKERGGSPSTSSACGGDGQRPCTVAPARFAGKKPAQCPDGAFFDLIDGGSCWRCPPGARRTLSGVTSPDACEVGARENATAATRHGRATGLVRTDCPRGQFFDPNGFCWSCPPGTSRTAAPVTAGNACVGAPARPSHSPAQSAGSIACPAGSFFDPVDGGTCWSCPNGYARSASHVKSGDACATGVVAGLGAEFGTCNQGFVVIRGTCSRVGQCGAQGQRPCLVGERTPSCNANLREDFKSNTCVALKPGETPFLAGLASASEFYGDTLRAVCRQGLGSLNIPAQTQLVAAGANCAKDVVAGAACEFVVEQAGGKLAKTVGSAIGATALPAQFKAAVDHAYVTAPCNGFAERTAPAQRLGTGGGAARTDCPAGRFWDPDGGCYACPSGYTRTLNPVSSPAACVDKPGGEIVRSACSAFKAVDGMFGGSARCAVEVMQSGVFLSQPLDFQSASQEYCMATGEFAYSVYKLVAAVNESPQQKEEQLTGSLRRLVAAVKRDPSRAAGLTLAGAKVGAKGFNAIERFNDLQSCR